jgi:hypothetical protein
MVQWNGRVVAPVEARSAVQVVHLRLGARSARKVRITTDGAEVRGASGEIVVGEGSRSGVASVTRGGAGVAVDGVHVVVVRWLPVDRLETLVELLRAAELPLTEDGPEDEDTSDGCNSGNENGENIALLFGSCAGHRRCGGGSSINSLSLG